MALVKEAVHLAGAPPDGQLNLRVEHAAVAPELLDIAHPSPLAARDVVLGQARRLGDVDLAPAQAMAQRAQHATDSLIVHNPNDADRDLPGA